jgi:hypothetical protein
MGALDTAREIGRIATTATLGKDVIDLLEKKVALLTEQITALDEQITVLGTENTNLKKKAADLEQQLASFNPIEEALDDVSIKFLKLLFDHGAVSTSFAAQELKIAQGIADYHRDILYRAKLIYEFQPGFVSTTSSFRHRNPTYKLTPKGREYVVKNVLPGT